MEFASFLKGISFFSGATVTIQVPAVLRHSDKIPVITRQHLHLFMLQIPHLMLFTVMFTKSAIHCWNTSLLLLSASTFYLKMVNPPTHSTFVPATCKGTNIIGASTVIWILVLVKMRSGILSLKDKITFPNYQYLIQTDCRGPKAYSEHFKLKWTVHKPPRITLVQVQWIIKRNKCN